MVINTANISPFLIETHYLSIRWYGFLIAMAILISYLLALKAIKKVKISESNFDSIFMITVIAGIVGARLGFVIQNFSFYSQHLNQAVAFWDGGLSIHGAIILGVMALLISTRMLKVSFKNLANILAPYLMLSGSIGRWGNFFNKEIIGSPSNSFLKMFIPVENRPVGFENHSYFYPVFLFESVLLLAGFLIYISLKKKLEKYALIYVLIVYGLVRIIVEFFRIDYKPIFFYLDLAQIVSFAIIIITGVIAIISATKSASK